MFVLYIETLSALWASPPLWGELCRGLGVMMSDPLCPLGISPFMGRAVRGVGGYVVMMSDPLCPLGISPFMGRAVQGVGG